MRKGGRTARMTLRSDQNYSDAADSLGAGCFADTGRAAATRRVAFLRRKYATRRLRLIRTLCCCPMHLYGLKIAETQLSLKPILLFQRRLIASLQPLLLAQERRLAGVSPAGLDKRTCD
jgi:hypothetical protein